MELTWRIVQRRRQRAEQRRRLIAVGFAALTGLLTVAGITRMVSLLRSPRSHVASVTVRVTTGDTLWKFAQDYKAADMDVREMVYEIAQANALPAGSHLRAGQILRIPDYRHPPVSRPQYVARPTEALR